MNDDKVVFMLRLLGFGSVSVIEKGSVRWAFKS